MKSFTLILALLLTTLSLFPGCKKWRDNKEPLTAINNALAESSYLDVFRIVTEYTRIYEGGGFQTDNCASITVGTTGGTFPVSLNLDYGAEDCGEFYNIKRRGSLQILLNKHFSETGATALVSFNGFYVNGSMVGGSVTITHKGMVDGKAEYSLVIENGIITESTEGIISYACNRTLIRVVGENTLPFVWDDVYEITGTASGVNTDGRSFEETVKEALTFTMDCRWITKGKSEIVPDDRKTISIDYGNGTCDNKAEVEIGKRKISASAK